MKRRSFILTGLAAGIFSGCVTDSTRNGTNQDREDTNETKSDENESTRNGLDYKMKLLDRSEPNEDSHYGEADPANTIRFDVEKVPIVSSDDHWVDEETPRKLDLTIENISDDSITVFFEGFVPFPDPHGQCEADFELLCLPGENLKSWEANQSVPEFVYTGRKWEISEPISAPDDLTEVSLEPGEKLGGIHHIVWPKDEFLETDATFDFSGNIGIHKSESEKSQIELDFSVNWYSVPSN